jgi:hypothetical protein
MGGKEIDCPYCGGTGKEPDLAEEIAKLEQNEQDKQESSKKQATPAKDKAVHKKRTRKKKA